MVPSYRYAVAGSPDFAVAVFSHMQEMFGPPVWVLTQVDKKCGRGQRLAPNPVAKWAEQNLWPLYQIADRTDWLSLRKQPELTIDFLLVIGLGLLIPKSWLSWPRFGCWNVHTSMLPAWRGAAPVQYALRSGQKQTGVTLMKIDAGLDTGPIISQQVIVIDPEDDSHSIHHKMVMPALDMINQAWHQLPELTVYPQQGEPSYAHKLLKQDGQIDWLQAADQIECHIRAMQPWPQAFTYWNHQPVKIWQASVVSEEQTGQSPGTWLMVDREMLKVACGQGILGIKKLQWPGAKPMPFSMFVQGRGKHWHAGDQFENQL